MRISYDKFTKDATVVVPGDASVKDLETLQTDITKYLVARIATARREEAEVTYCVGDIFYEDVPDFDTLSRTDKIIRDFYILVACTDFQVRQVRFIQLTPPTARGGLAGPVVPVTNCLKVTQSELDQAKGRLNLRRMQTGTVGLDASH